jgi:peptidoglycan/LPS O-acetylase OafA/YrhL
LIPDPSPHRRRDIDGLRALAISLVVAYHAVPDLLRGGFVGVDVFFVLSGYLISGILAADTAPGAFRRFYERRARRLFPALVVVLVSTLVLGHQLLLADAFERLARHTAAAALFVANFAFWLGSGYFDSGALEKPLLHLWSLGIEEQFYLVWPALLWWLLRRGPRFAVAATAALALVSFAATVAFAPEAPDAVFYLPWFRFWELLAGAILAQVPALHAASQRSWPGTLASAAGLALVFASAVLIDPTRPYPSWNALGPVVGTSLLVWGGERSWLGRVALSARPVVALGLISYPLYLWHWPLLSFQAEIDPTVAPGERLVVLLLAVLLAAATYLGVERPVRRLHGRRPVAVTVALAAAIALLAAGSWFLRDLQPRRSAAPTPTVAFLETQHQLDFALRKNVPTRPCETTGPMADPLAGLCTVSGPSAGAPPIVLWGDSTAASWAPLVRAVASDNGQPAIVVSVSGCPPLLGVHGPFHPGCDPAAMEALAGWVESQRPSHLVLAARWGAYVNERRPGDHSPLHYLTLESEGEATAATSRAAVAQQLPVTLRRLSAVAPLVVFAAVPDLLQQPIRALPFGVEYRPTAGERRQAQELTDSLLRAAAREGLPITVVDPSERLCAGGRCEAMLGETLVYLDHNHVTAQGALLFRPELAAALARFPR